MNLLFGRLVVIVLLLIAFNRGTSQTFYISPNGSDTEGNGSKSLPWRSLSKASSAVNRQGSIIHVLPGIYRENATCYVAPGVSLEGEGKGSILQSSFSDEWIPILALRSPEGTNGNQHISGLTFDGQNLFTSWAIKVAGRNHVEIRDCLIRDFRDRGVIFTGRIDNEELPPGIYSIGNSFHDNELINCAAYNINGNEYGRGCLNLGGQDSMDIYNNFISQESRPDGYNGFPIKYINNGFLKRTRIFKNNISKKPFVGKFGGDNGWDFAIELWNVVGMVEIFDNTIQGATDIVISSKGDYKYGVWFHDNKVIQKQLSKFYESGIIFEFSNSDVIVEHNSFSNISGAVLFYAQKNSVLTSIKVHNNKFYNLGREDGPGNNSKGILFDCGDIKEGDKPFVARDITITDNEFFPAKGREPMFGIELTGHSKISDLKIGGNKFSNFRTAFISINPGKLVDSLSVSENTMVANGNNNDPLFLNGKPSNYIFERNINQGGTLPSISQFGKQSPLIRKLYYEFKESEKVLYIAMFLLIPVFWLSSRFNANGFLSGALLLTVISMVFLKDKHFVQAFIAGFFIALNTYGFISGKNHVLFSRRMPGVGIVLFTISIIIIVYSLFYIIKNLDGLFPIWTSTIALGFLAIISAILGMWTMIKNYHWNAFFWIASAVISGLTFYRIGFILPAITSVMILLISIFNVFDYKRSGHHIVS